MRRVVVTGMGAINLIGLNIDEFWNGIRNSRIGIAPITKFDASDYKVKIAAEVKGFDARDFIESKTARRMELFSQYAVVTACVTGTHNIGETYRTIRYGDADVMGAGGTEACVTQLESGALQL